jgi:hypothetical protein
MAWEKVETRPKPNMWIFMVFVFGTCCLCAVIAIYYYVSLYL